MSESIVLILSSHHPVLTDILDEIGVSYFIHLSGPIEDIPLEKKSAVCGIVTSNSFALPGAVLALFKNIRFVGRLGSGMEIIDVDYCQANNIECWSSPMGNANAVAEHALGMLLSIKNNIRRSHIQLNRGLFCRKENTGHELNSAQVGIIGLGSNGSLFANKLLHLGCRVKGYDIDLNKRDLFVHDNFIFAEDISELYSCDTISLHIPFNHSTRHIINRDFVQHMHSPFTLLNVARGPLLDTWAFFNGLRSGKILAAGIDVWEYEPVQDFPVEYAEALEYILSHENVIATPHIAGYSYEATYNMSKIIGDHIMEFFKRNFWDK